MSAASGKSQVAWWETGCREAGGLADCFASCGPQRDALLHSKIFLPSIVSPFSCDGDTRRIGVTCDACQHCHSALRSHRNISSATHSALAVSGRKLHLTLAAAETSESSVLLPTVCPGMVQPPAGAHTALQI